MDKLQSTVAAHLPAPRPWLGSRRSLYDGHEPSAVNARQRHTGDGLAELLELSRDISNCTDVDVLLPRIEATALRVLACERLTVFTNERNVNELRSRFATGIREIRTPVDRGIAATTFREGRLFNVHDVSADSRFYDQIDRQTGYSTRSLLSIPLRGVEHEVNGVLELLNKRAGCFTDNDEELALTLASLTEMTLQRQTLVDGYHEKRRLEHELELAKRIQRSLLPATDPRVPGYDISGWSQACAATGGDFYDYFDLPDGRLGLVVADVAGHGLAASLLACETRALIRSAASSRQSLVDIVASANDLLYHDLHHERFVVLFLGALDPVSGHLEFVSAGCVALVCQRGVMATLGATIPPLAVFRNIPDLTAASVTLGPGDVAVLTTDGFFEWENDRGEQYGLNRLSSHIGAHSKQPPAELIRSLLRDVRAYGGEVKQADDLTAMVVRRVH